MTPAPADEEKKEALALYNSGRYAESLALCNRLLEAVRDPALEILAATNLFSLGKLEDAEVHFRDLTRRMPDSSHVHSYLAKVLELTGDDDAIAEYASAVRLDPANQNALRSYATRLVALNDERGALPVLQQLYRIGKRPEDLRLLIAALTQSGRPEEACRICETHESGKLASREYTEALYAAGRYREAADEARGLYTETRDPAILRVYLAAHAHADADAAPAAYALSLKEVLDPGIYLDYTLLLQERGEYLRALATVKKLIALDNLPKYRLIECELSAALGDNTNALKEYETLIQDELNAPAVSDTFRQILLSYRRYISEQFPPEEALNRFLAIVPGDTNVVCLGETARMYRDRENVDEARSWYYRAYRADYLNGGLLYAEFLASCKDDRECEKVLLHILANVRKTADLSRVAAAVTEHEGNLQRMRRLNRQLIRRLEERRQTLRSEDRDYLAAAYRREAADALSRDEYAAGMYNCLCGIDVLPAYSRTCRADDFLVLINRTKELMLSDTPVITPPPAEKTTGSGQTLQEMMDRMAFSDPEQKIVIFLATHRRASETDLRRLLDTRRVAGIINLLIRKAKAQGIMLIEKKGMSTEGEVYEYCGP
jgi:tetratricopeptide (TPR) repeat protein